MYSFIAENHKMCDIYLYFNKNLPSFLEFSKRSCFCVFHEKLFYDIQGLQYILTHTNSLLLQNFESEKLPGPTGGSPDVVHLLKYASLVFG